METLLERRKRLLGKAYRLFYDNPVHIVRGEGVWLFDADGKRYLDVYNNVPHVGHCHPRVVEAIHHQAQILNTHTRYLHETVLDYAERLTARFPAGLDIAMFACTGTEANELALRLARAATGNDGMIITEHAYHGNSWAVAQITSCYTKAEQRGDNIVTVPTPDMFRGLYANDKAAAQKYAAHVQAAVETLVRNGHRPAALIVDTVFANEGLPNVPPTYLQQAVDIVRRAGGLFIADEVQPGFGRLGDHFWGYERHGVVPDIVTLGKPMANGYPVSAVVTTKPVTDAFSRDAHYFNTFAGTPVACAAALAVLEVIDQQDLVAKALKTGEYLFDHLKDLATDHDMIGDVRGSGLFIGIELVRDHDNLEPATVETAKLVNLLRNRGILINSTGLYDNVLKIRPPMIFGAEHADLLLQKLAGALEEIRAPVHRKS
ncbi:MAG: aminotransferase class III-fold pyridoxal phosphate-dependent enzyme [Xanthomonadales bacterium]|nr:aminotransferase class III-fold pyridoxal phosphate-dependent enzyme [Xanthomonadales bacterium]